MILERQRAATIAEYLFQGLFILTLICLPFSKSAGKHLLVAMAANWVILQLIRNGRFFLSSLLPRTFLNLPLFFFLASLVFAVVFSRDPYISQQVFFQRYLVYSLVFMLGFAASGMLLRTQPRALVLVFILLGIGIGIGGISDYLAARPYRLFTVFGKGLYFDAFLLYFFAISLAQALLSKDKLVRWLSIISLFALVPVLIWHSSRLLWLSVVALVLFFSLFASKRHLVFFVAVLLVGGILILPVSQRNRAKSLLKIYTAQAYSDRLYMIGYAVDMGMKKPLTGAGPGMFEYLYRPPRGHEAERSYQHSHAHNAYVELFAEAGSAGLFSFLFLFAVFIRRGWSSCKRLPEGQRTIFLGFFAAVGSVLFCCLGGSFIIVGAQDAFMFWLVLGIAVAIAQTSPKEKETVDG